MKALRLFLCLTMLSVFLAAVIKGRAAEEKETRAASKVGACAERAAQMRRSIQAKPDQLEEIFRRTISESTHCACELLTEAIRLSDGSELAVKQLVVIALRQAEGQASAIAECAVLVAPNQLGAIREAFEEVQPGEMPASKKPDVESKESSRDKGRVSTMIKKLVPGLDKKKESKPDSKSGAKVESSEKFAAKGGPKSVGDERVLLDFRHHSLDKDVVEEDLLVSRRVTDLPGTEMNLKGSFLDPFAFGSHEILWWDSRERLPGKGGRLETEGLRFFAYLENGYDSNVGTDVAGERVDSYFLEGGIGTYYSLVTDATRIDVRAKFGARYEERVPADMDHELYRGRLLSNVQHKISDWIQVSNRTGISYDAEPDFLSGETLGYRSDQYFFGYNRLAIGLRWARQFESRTYYALSAIHYEDEWIEAQEDRWRHVWGQQLRFLWDEQKVGFVEYRYAQTDFRAAANDSQSHYILGGLEYGYSPGRILMATAGAENRCFESFPDEWKPYAEVSFQARLSDRTVARLGGRLGYEDVELRQFHNRYSLRAAVLVDHKIHDLLQASVGFFYLRSDVETAGDGAWGYYEDAVMLQLALRYAWFDNFDVYLAYDFTQYDSGDPLRNYDRHRVTMGVNSHF